MRNPGRGSVRPAVRALRRPAAVSGTTTGVLAVSSGTAVADPVVHALQAEPNALTFGLLGPVGLVAVALGVLGMVAGVVRQRRERARAAAEADAPEQARPAQAPLDPDVVAVPVAHE